jgi:hypothetical protein
MSTKIKQQILLDHKKVGKKYIPPLIHHMGSPLKETSWVKQSLPELLWIALLNYRYGYVQGADLSLSLAKAVKKITGKNEWYAPMSSFSSLTKKERLLIIEELKREGKIKNLSIGLAPLNSLYPRSPLAFISIPKGAEEDKEVYLSIIKNSLTDLYDKRTKEATFTQANAVYICFVLGKLQVSSKTSLANFPEIENYPLTEESKKIAAFVRATINGFIGMDLGDDLTDWQNYFWNRGLEIEACE